jgi:hypothetical protein
MRRGGRSLARSGNQAELIPCAPKVPGVVETASFALVARRPILVRDSWAVTHLCRQACPETRPFNLSFHPTLPSFTRKDGCTILSQPLFQTKSILSSSIEICAGVHWIDDDRDGVWTLLLTNSELQGRLETPRIRPNAALVFPLSYSGQVLIVGQMLTFPHSNFEILNGN